MSMFIEKWLTNSLGFGLRSFFGAHAREKHLLGRQSNPKMVVCGFEDGKPRFFVSTRDEVVTADGYHLRLDFACCRPNRVR